MALWAVVAAVYGGVLVVAALVHPIRRRAVALVAALAYVLVALATGSLVTAFWIHVLVPGALLLAGYWLSGLFFRAPQPWLERWLRRVDHSCGAEQWMAALPRAAAELLELSYASASVLVGGGALYAASFGLDAVHAYWALVLAAELASFAPLPWLRSRPPRTVAQAEGPSRDRDGAPPATAIGRLNAAILDRVSVQANTLPSGHVSGTVAAALAVMAFDAAAGWALLLTAGLIAGAAIAGRYHYVVDCVAGAMVALAFSALM